MTLIVFAFAVIMAIFLFAVDTSIGYIIQWLTKRGWHFAGSVATTK